MANIPLVVLLVFLLVWRAHVGFTRFFDVDEFTYLHWAGQIARGEVFYKEIFTYFTPGLFWLLAPLYWLFGISTKIFVAARAFSFIVFLGTLGALGYLWAVTRGWKWVLLPAVIFAFLPMPYDKLLEVRPDNLASLLALLGLICLTRRRAFWSGFFYSLSLLVLVKMLPFVVVGAAVAIVLFWKQRNTLPRFLLGLGAPWIFFFTGEALMGNVEAAWYSLTKLVFEASRGAAVATMGPDFFFYPNASFYGGDGYSVTAGLVINHALWLIAIVVGLHRLLSRWALPELLVSGTFFLLIFGYVSFFPMKHSQYLIPISVFVAYYAADGLATLFDRVGKRTGNIVLALLVSLGAYFLATVTVDVNNGKLASSYTGQMAELTTLIDTIPRSSRVVDLEGRMVFWREGYPVCCLPFDYFLGYVSRPIPPLARYLSDHPADYIFQGDTNRFLNFSPENLSFVKAHYEPVPGWGEKLWRRREE